MDITIVTNGNIENKKTLKLIIENSDYIICADGAAKYLMDLNILPNLLVGDLDSIDKHVLEWTIKNSIETRQFPARKDMTDTELAVEFALKQMPDQITIVGAIGTRMDHSLGNIMLLYKIYKEGIKAKIINEFNEIIIADKDISIEGETGQTISIIPIGGDVEGITLEGLEYPLMDHNIPLGSSLGISNRFIQKKANIIIKKGIVLIIKVLNEK